MKNIKKGDASEIVTFLVIVFFLAVSFIVVIFANSKIQEVIDSSVLNVTDVAVDSSEQITLMTTKTVQRGFVAIVAFLILGIMVSSFMVNVHPVFLFVYIFILAVSIFVAVPLANTYQMLIGFDVLSDIASQQTMINWIMEHLVLVILGTGALSMIILFGKLRGQSAGGSDF